MATPVSRLVTQSAFGRAHPSRPRVRQQCQPRSRSIHHPSPCQRPPSTRATPCRSATKEHASSCKVSTGGSALKLGQCAGAMSHVGSSHMRRSKSRPAYPMHRKWPPWRIERSQRNVTDVTDVTVGHMARSHRPWSPVGRAGPWDRLGRAYRAIE